MKSAQVVISILGLSILFFVGGGTFVSSFNVYTFMTNLKFLGKIWAILGGKCCGAHFYYGGNSRCAHAVFESFGPRLLALQSICPLIFTSKFMQTAVYSAHCLNLNSVSGTKDNFLIPYLQKDSTCKDTPGQSGKQKSQLELKVHQVNLVHKARCNLQVGKITDRIHCTLLQKWSYYACQTNITWKLAKRCILC